MTETKVVGCAVCGEPQTVPKRARNHAVRCPIHDAKLVSNPFAETLTPEMMRLRVEGRTVTLHRTLDSVAWEEDIEVSRLRSTDTGGSGTISVTATGGGFRYFNVEEVVCVR